MKRKSYTPAPWQVYYKQLNSMGRASRPVVQDLKGKKIGNRPQDAELMAVAPELLLLVDSLANALEFRNLQIVSALELHKVPADPLFQEAKRLLRRLASVGVIP